MEDDAGGLFNIELSSSDESVDVKEKVPRDFQSQDDFERQRKEWKPKMETGEVNQSLFNCELCFFSCWVLTLSFDSSCGKHSHFQ
jgi:hypothetical protein